MAEPAGHSHSVWSHQGFTLVVILVRVVSIRVPFFCRGLIEIGVGEQPHPYDAGLVAIKRTHREVLTVDFRAAGADFHSRIFLLILERIGFAICATPIEPKSPSLRI